MADMQVIPEAVRQATVDCFKVMVQDNAQVLATKVEVPQVQAGFGIIAVAGIKATQLDGTIAIYFPATTFVPLMNKMLGENQTEICEANADGANEFLNIIYASARTKINEAGFDFQPAIPSTLKGEKLELSRSANAKALQLECRCSFGPFTVVVQLTPR